MLFSKRRRESVAGCRSDRFTDVAYLSCRLSDGVYLCWRFSDGGHRSDRFTDVRYRSCRLSDAGYLSGRLLDAMCFSWRELEPGYRSWRESDWKARWREGGSLRSARLGVRSFDGGLRCRGRELESKRLRRKTKIAIVICTSPRGALSFKHTSVSETASDAAFFPTPHWRSAFGMGRTSWRKRRRSESLWCSRSWDLLCVVQLPRSPAFAARAAVATELAGASPHLDPEEGGTPNECRWMCCNRANGQTI